MQLQLNAYSISLFLSALISGGVGFYVWRKRSVTAGKELALLMFAVAWWGFFQSFEAASTSRFMKMLWTTINYPGNMTAPVLFLLFALRYTGNDKWIDSRKALLLWAIPAVSVIMAATSGLQHVLWSHVTLTDTSLGVIAVYGHGPWYWVEVFYSWALVAWALFVIGRASWRLDHPYSAQARLVLLAGVTPIVAQLVYAFSPAMIEGMDITPITFSVTSILVAAALLRYHMLDLRPIASGVLYDGIRDAMVAVDQDNRVVDMNGPACELVGRSPAEAIGSPVVEVFAHVPDLVDRLRRDDLEAHGEIEVGEDDRRHYDLRVWPLRDRRERLLGKLVTLHDVTEIKRVQEELERINAELDGYAHTVSHDLKGPLTSIMLANQALERLLASPETPERNDKINNILEMLMGSTEKANDHINCLLALAVAAQKPAAVEAVDVGRVVDRVLEEHRGDIEDHRARVRAGDLGTVQADPTHVYQLFSNLIGNSFQHNAGLDLKVDVRRLPSDNGSHRFLVRDNGQGIGEADLDKIFEPFYTAGSTGSGIGLATAQRIVGVYGGTIEAYNDRGACFEFSLNDWSLKADPSRGASSGLAS